MNNLEEIKTDALQQLEKASDLNALAEFYAAYLAKKGKLSGLMSALKDLPNEEKAAYGAKVNALKEEITSAYLAKKDALSSLALNAKLEKESIDLSLPGTSLQIGSINPYHLIIDEVSDIFVSVGYEIYEGRDVESEFFNFECLNVPKDHPSRDMQDTFYINKEVLLRTQTSAAQGHAMQDRKGNQPIKMICPGKAYRKDDDDATHSHQFGQIEGLYIDKKVSMADLKGTLELFAKKMFGEVRQIRMRGSYFPFTEPSVEVDVSCFNCGGKGCHLCKNTGWIEILGAGMVNPKVLEACGYDSNIWSGFAFGVGIERVAMLRYGIDDIRRFYSDDLRFLSPFKGK